MFLHGTLRRSVGRYRVTVEMHDSTGFVVWSERFDVDPDNHEDGQEQIASAIATRCRLDYSLLRAMHEVGVPIDVVSGVSGGALMGAYYCKDGLAGLDRAERRGRRFLLAMLGAVVWSGFIEQQVDRDLNGARVDELEVLFVPVTTVVSCGLKYSHVVVSPSPGRIVTGVE